MDVNLKQGRIWPAKLLDPAVQCPNCKQPVQGFVGAQSLYAGGVADRAEALEGVPESKLRGTMVYTLYPCYCQVDQYWMSAFSEEMGRRDKGKTPRNVEGRSAANRQALSEEIQGRLRVLYTKRDAAVVANMAARKAALEREICLLVTELQRATPGAHNSCPPITLEPEVLQWARQSKLDTPPGSSEPEAAVKLTLEQLHKFLCVDPEFNAKHNSRKLLLLATAMYRELQDFAAKGKPVSQSTLAVVVKLVPGADSFITAREVEGPELEDPHEKFTDDFARRRKRRLDVRGVDAPDDEET